MTGVPDKDIHYIALILIRSVNAGCRDMGNEVWILDDSRVDPVAVPDTSIRPAAKLAVRAKQETPRFMGHAGPSRLARTRGYWR